MGFLGGLFGGGGGSSSSTSSTTNTDKRMALDTGVGVSSDSSTVTVNALDSGAVAGALDFASNTNSAISANYDKLLSGTGQALSGIFALADKALAGGYKSLDTTQGQFQTTLDTAQSKGTLDNRTITVLGVAAAAIAAFALRKK